MSSAGEGVQPEGCSPPLNRKRFSLRRWRGWHNLIKEDGSLRRRAEKTDGGRCVRARVTAQFQRGSNSIRFIRDLTTRSRNEKKKHKKKKKKGEKSRQRI